MFHTDIQLTYHTPEVFLPTDHVSESEEAFIRNVIYRQELLDIFGIEPQEEREEVGKQLEQQLDALFDIIRYIPQCQQWMAEYAMQIMGEDWKDGLCVMFSYDYLHLMYPQLVACLQENVQENVQENIQEAKNLCT